MHVPTLMPEESTTEAARRQCDQLEARMRVRNLVPSWADPGPAYWRALAELGEPSPPESLLDEFGAWLLDTLFHRRDACVVPLCAPRPRASLWTARLLANHVQLVVVAPLDRQGLDALDGVGCDTMGGLGAVLLAEEYQPLAGTAQCLARFPGLATGPDGAVLLWTDGRQAPSWSAIGEMLDQDLPGAKVWSCPVPPTLPRRKDLLEQMYAGGCRQLRIRARSLSPLSLARLRAPGTLDQLVALLRSGRLHGLQLSLSLEVGFPWETRDLHLATLAHARTLAPWIDGVHDLRSFVPEGARHDWHDGGVNNASHRLKRARELAVFLDGCRTPTPWFHRTAPPQGTADAAAIHARLLTQT